MARLGLLNGIAGKTSCQRATGNSSLESRNWTVPGPPSVKTLVRKGDGRPFIGGVGSSLKHVMFTQDYCDLLAEDDLLEIGPKEQSLSGCMPPPPKPEQKRCRFRSIPGEQQPSEHNPDTGPQLQASREIISWAIWDKGQKTGLRSSGPPSAPEKNSGDTEAIARRNCGSCRSPRSPLQPPKPTLLRTKRTGPQHPTPFPKRTIRLTPTPPIRQTRPQPATASEEKTGPQPATPPTGQANPQPATAYPWKTEPQPATPPRRQANPQPASTYIEKTRPQLATPPIRQIGPQPATPPIGQTGPQPATPFTKHSRA
eukprot:jgi/Botrbrau1/16083/Bobra.7_2s0054.1